MKNCDDPRKLKIFNGRKLLNIARLKTEKERRVRLKLLMRNYRLLPRTPAILLPSINPDRQPIATIANNGAFGAFMACLCMTPSCPFCPLHVPFNVRNVRYMSDI